MALLPLKDLTQALEIARRARRELAEGQVRDAMDAQILELTRHVTNIVGQDERLDRRRQIEQQIKAAAPSPQSWASALAQGKIERLIELVATGATAAQAWKQVLS